MRTCNAATRAWSPTERRAPPPWSHVRRPPGVPARQHPACNTAALLSRESTLKQVECSWFGETRPRTRSWGRSVCHRRLDGAPAARMKMHIPWLQAVTLLVRAGPGTCRPRFSCACWPRARGRRDARRARAAVVHSSAGCMQACPLRAASALQRPPPPRTRWRAWDAPRSPACGAQHCRLVLPTHSRTPQRAAGLPVCVRACMGACVTV